MKKVALLTGFFFANTLVVYSFLLMNSCQSKVKKDVPVAVTEVDPGVMKGMKQLTFVGPRSGEGYFNRDGTKMIFQSERFEGNPFYQIYLMDMNSGKTELVSPGHGKTTCAWIHPFQPKVMFSSTHLDPEWKKKQDEEWAARKSPQKNKYSWSFDDSFDIFEKDLQSNKIKRLTNAKGYDAEGSYSPDGQWIAFASNRAAYTEKLSDEDKKLFSQDASYMMDIYIMRADGSQVKRLTDVKGYDGGPFFSADGKKITWRRFSPNGQIAEIWTMNIDGSEQKQLTHLKAMSWAPFFHPSGDYVIFTTNKLGFSNFELYIVDSEGKKDPVRVSYIPDFDGLPVFSPSGTELSWTHRNEKGESQIYLSQWDDKKARELLGLPLKTELRLANLSPQINEQDVKSIIGYLASEKMNGRSTGSVEEKVYTQTFSNLFQGMGLSALSNKGFTSSFEFTSEAVLRSKEDSSNQFKVDLAGKILTARLEEDYTPIAISKSGDFPLASMVFAGYGIVAPATDKEPLYDSYQNLDVKNKWVLIFRDIPENIPNPKRLHLNMFSRMEHKILVAKQRGASGLLVVIGPNSGSSQKLMKLKFQNGSAESSLPILSVSPEFAEKIISSTGRSLKQWQDIHDKGEIQTTEISKVQASAKVDLKYNKSLGLNVLAVLNVKGATENIMVGAHGDHLGRGEFGSSLARNNEQGQIHFGADDNASGVAGVLELAHHLSALQRTGKIKLKKNIIFAIWSGEEIGLIGSTKWLEQNKDLKIAAYLNMDMIGRLRDQLMVQGVGSAKEWKNVFEELISQTDLHVLLQEDPYVPSDSMAFYMKGIPSVMFFTGAHAEYHSPRDTVETINFTGEVKILDLMEKTILKLADNSPQTKLTYLKSESSKTNLQGRSFRVYLGTIPDYSQEGIKGVKISGTSKESPAEKAGLKTGDVIIELAGLKIENLYDYVYGLQSLKANQVVEIKVMRQGQVANLSITPLLKD